jgi:BirA family biotin operon repressor/biotin-[acetyl-CoA-carboxylase] ligase
MDYQYDKIDPATLWLLDQLKQSESGIRPPADLGVSPDQMRHGVDQLKQLGYQIQVSEEFGLKLSEFPEMIFSWEVSAKLPNRFIGSEVRSFPVIDSTNRYAKNWAVQGAPHGAVVVTDQQLQGRGRFDRNWASPKGKGLYFSVVLRPVFKMGQVSLLTLLMSVVVAEAANEISGIKALIKWPNDVLCEGRKISGILAEAKAGKGNKPDFVVIGTGINVNLDPDDFPQDAKGTSLKIIHQGKISRFEFFQRILQLMESHYVNFDAYGYPYLKEQWDKNNGTIGHEVVINTESGGNIAGSAIGLNDNGGLIVRLRDGTQRVFMAEDVSIGSFRFQ